MIDQRGFKPRSADAHVHGVTEWLRATDLGVRQAQTEPRNYLQGGMAWNGDFLSEFCSSVR